MDGIFDQLRFLMQVKYVYLISLVGECVVLPYTLFDWGSGFSSRVW